MTARGAAPRPFRVDIPDADLADLARRLEATRWPETIADAGSDYGTDVDALRALVDHWRDGYDWRAAEGRLNSHPQFTVEIDGQTLHYVHLKGNGPSSLPLLLSHGWPSSHTEMLHVIEPLADPGRFGGDPTDAFDVVLLSLPGYGFSPATGERGVNVARIGRLAHRLMTEVLGYDRYGAHGGDWANMVASRVAFDEPDHVVGLHLNLVGVSPHPKDRAELSEAESAWMKTMGKWQRTEMAYYELQGTKPQTLGFALNDSPVGLASWILEKFQRWTDSEGDLEQCISRDDLLTNISIYWHTQSALSAARLYYEERHNPWRMAQGARITVPTGVAAFPKEIVSPPREWAERVYDIVRWTDMPRGGHFPALEQPQLLVDDLRAFFRDLRST